MKRWSDIVIYTVPHTGTNFAGKFLTEIGIEKDTGWWRLHASRIHPDEMTGGQRFMEDIARDIPFLVGTARDPYLTTISYFGRSRHANISLSQWSFLNFFNMIESRDHFILDIGCREADRYEHLCDLADYLKVTYDADVVKAFAERWEPENVSDNHAKDAYIADGTLPRPGAGESWDLLNDAVEWYKSLLTNDT